MNPPLIALYMWWMNCDVAVKLSSWGAESRYDAVQSSMAEICMLAQQVLEGATRTPTATTLVSSLDIGCIPSLFFVATKCRDDAIRSRAILHSVRIIGEKASLTAGKLQQLRAVGEK